MGPGWLWKRCRVSDGHAPTLPSLPRRQQVPPPSYLRHLSLCMGGLTPQLLVTPPGDTHSQQTYLLLQILLLQGRPRPSPGHGPTSPTRCASEPRPPAPAIPPSASGAGSGAGGPSAGSGRGSASGRSLGLPGACAASGKSLHCVCSRSHERRASCVPRKQARETAHRRKSPLLNVGKQRPAARPRRSFRFRRLQNGRVSAGLGATRRLCCFIVFSSVIPENKADF